MNVLGRWCLSIAAMVGALPVIAQADVFPFKQKPGPFAVGLKVVSQYDSSRPFPLPHAKIHGRPLQTLIWYPALPSQEKSLTVGDYARLADSETDFDSVHSSPAKWTEQLKASSETTLWAKRDAAVARGQYPVVIYAPSDSSISWENADLCEYLASNGYIVVASPSIGASTRDMTDDVAGINAQARDISFLVTFAATLPHADPRQVAVLSWSWGGIASLFAAARDPRIKALASMDGSLRYFPGLVKKAGDVHPERMTLPLLYFTAEYPNFLEDFERYASESKDDMTGPNVLNAWTRGDLLTVNMLGMSHGEFSSMFQRRKSDEKYAEDQVGDFDRGDAATSYSWVAAYVLKFLDANLKHDASAAMFLKATPAANGVPRHFMGSAFRAAQAAQP